MKFKSSNQVLLRGISAVRNAVGSPISNPIVENIHISCVPGKIRFMATNLNLTIRCEGEVDVEEEGEILLNSSVITSVVQDLPQNDVLFETKGENVHIECGKFKAKMKGQSGELFPPFVAVEEGEEFEINSEKIKNVIRKTILSTSQEKSRYELNGVMFDIKEKTLNCVATDGRRLAIYKVVEEKIPEKDIASLIPEKTLHEVLRIFPDEGSIKIKFGERKVQFSCGDVYIISNLLMENFPQYEKIIPPEGEIKVLVNRNEFAAAVRRAANLTSVETNMVVLTIDSGKMEISGEREESGSEGRDQIDAEYTGDKIQIRFNHKFITDFLKIAEEEKVEIELRDSRKPGVFRTSEEKDYKYILMPMRPPEEEKSKEISS